MPPVIPPPAATNALGLLSNHESALLSLLFARTASGCTGSATTGMLTVGPRLRLLAGPPPTPPMLPPAPKPPLKPNPTRAFAPPPILPVLPLGLRVCCCPCPPVDPIVSEPDEAGVDVEFEFEVDVEEGG
ncbi:hypothetical protein NMY22_g16505 [Coprinellus aureogranulatus]|nr:hypothetical protein NMY22_g16505 [Coprinellus aureogranulatus]